MIIFMNYSLTAGGLTTHNCKCHGWCIFHNRNNVYQLSYDRKHFCVENTARCVEYTARCFENTARCVENTARRVENTARCVENTARCVENTARCVEKEDDSRVFFY